jgi:hypothetical protein
MVCRWLRASWLLACLTLAPVAAFAFETVDALPWPSSGAFPAYRAEEIRPWGFFVQGGVMHDDNVLRLPSGERSDNILRYGAGVRAEQLVYGRQRLLVEAVGEYYDYDTFSELDHFAYGLRGEWLWELGNQLAGTVGYRRRKRLADVGEIQAPVRDLITEDRLYAAAAYRFAPDWRLTGGAEWGKAEHSDRPIADAGATTVRGGIVYVTPIGNRIGAEVRRTEGEAPVDETLLGPGAFAGNEFRETEYAATLLYGLGVTLRVGGRIGYTERTYTLVQGRDFSGTSGRATIEWLPGPRTILAFEAFHEPSAVLDADALHVVRTGFAFGPSWAPTPKLVLSARFSWEERDYEGDPRVVTGAPERDETLRFVRLGAGWEMTRNLQLSAALDRGDRDSNIAARDYRFTAATLNLRFVY